MKWWVRLAIAWWVLAIVVAAGGWMLVGGMSEPIVLINGEPWQVTRLEGSSMALMLAAVMGMVLLCLALLSVAVPLVLLLVGGAVAAVLCIVALVVLSIGGVVFAPVLLLVGLAWWLWRKTASAAASV